MIRKSLAAVCFILICLSFAAAGPKPNLVLITLDSARADRMGFLGAKGSLTPNLDHLATESIVFEHAYAQAPGTVVSHATILSGAYPQSTGMSEIGGTLPPSLLYLPDLLKSQSYKTAAFVGSIELDPVSGLAQGFDRGFQTYDAGFRPDHERDGVGGIARGKNFVTRPLQQNFQVREKIERRVETDDSSVGRMGRFLRRLRPGGKRVDRFLLRCVRVEDAEQVRGLKNLNHEW